MPEVDILNCRWPSDLLMVACAQSLPAALCAGCRLSSVLFLAV